MPAESKRSIHVSIGCDLAIAGATFVAATFTGSAAMLSEGIHSLMDCSNEVSPVALGEAREQEESGY